MTEGREPVRLWDGVAPGSESWAMEEQVFELVVGGTGRGIRNVVSPTMTPHLPEVPDGRAVIVCPGGALHYLCIETEGEAVADWLVQRGVAAFVLKYRLVPTPVDEEGFGRAFMAALTDYEKTTSSTLPLAAADAARAVQIIRERGYPHVTLMGFSAGGIVTAEAAMRSAADSRPDAAAVLYAPRVSNCTADAKVPPMFIAAASDDPMGVQGSIDLSRAWLEAGRPVELHLFERGGHGFGVETVDLPVRSWRDLFLDWLDTHSESAGR
jgi:acetyl esterase/lipase